MSKWKLFGKSKSSDKSDEEIVQLEPVEEEQQIEETTHEEVKPAKKQILAEHHETLHAENPSSKKSIHKGKDTSSDQMIWRDTRAIEENVDNLHITKSDRPRSNLDKTVDKLLEKQKKK